MKYEPPLKKKTLEHVTKKKKTPTITLTEYYKNKNNFLFKPRLNWIFGTSFTN
jgi:hypothetical protein